jgi:hypothetical protein
MKKDAERPQKPRGAWVTPVIVAIIGGIFTVAAAYIGNRGGFTEILPGSPVRTVTLEPRPAAQTAAPGTDSNSNTNSRYLYTLTPVENNTNTAITSGQVQMGNSSYPNSVGVECFAEPQNFTAEIAYDVNGARFLNATVGVPNDATNAYYILQNWPERSAWCAGQRLGRKITGNSPEPAGCCTTGHHLCSHQ